MKRILYLLPCLLLLQVHAQEKEPFLSIDDLPNMIHVLPPPPDTLSPGFAYDIMEYMWGKEQRHDSVRLAIAVRDAVWNVETMCREFSEPFGLVLSKENTPELYKLLVMVATNTELVGRKPKAHYMRKRPYVRFNEPTIAPWDEEGLRNNGSYPSGHTILGWSTALVLTEINPERQDTILARGYMYGESRVIAGFHWRSDVNAGFLSASAAVARLHAEPLFREQIEKARQELWRKKVK